MKLRTIALASALAMSSTFALAQAGDGGNFFRTGCERRVQHGRSQYDNWR